MNSTNPMDRRKEDSLQKYEIKIPRGTIIKVCGSAMRLDESLYLTTNEEEGGFQLKKLKAVV